MESQRGSEANGGPFGVLADLRMISLRAAFEPCVTRTAPWGLVSPMGPRIPHRKRQGPRSSRSTPILRANGVTTAALRADRPAIRSSRPMGDVPAARSGPRFRAVRGLHFRIWRHATPTAAFDYLVVADRRDYTGGGAMFSPLVRSRGGVACSKTKSPPIVSYHLSYASSPPTARPPRMNSVRSLRAALSANLGRADRSGSCTLVTEAGRGPLRSDRPDTSQVVFGLRDGDAGSGPDTARSPSRGRPPASTAKRAHSVVRAAPDSA
jgi:hypothetical protein